MFRRSIFAALACVFLCTGIAEASHFRFGQTTWRRIANNPDGSVTVEFTSTQAWRTSALDMLGLDFDDGNFYSPASQDITDIFTGLDLAGESYTIRRYIVQHTYSSTDITSKGGVFVANSESCCRIFSLLNASSADERIQTVVNLNNNNQGSAVSSIPVILQMSISQINTLTIASADPDGDTLGCRMATSGESEIPSLASVGSNVISVSPSCILSWDLTNTTIADVGSKFAVQVMIEETNRCNGQNLCGGIALDFIIELVQGNPPTCASDKPANNTLYVDHSFSATFTGTDSDPGALLTVTSFNAPSGSNLSPVSGSQQAAPFAATFQWTPQESDRGSVHSMLVTFQDETGLQSVCTLSLTVSQTDPVFTCSPVNVEPLLFALDGNAFHQKALALQGAKQLKKTGKAGAKAASQIVKLANALYQQTWISVWSKLHSIAQDCSSSPNVEFCSTVAVNGASISEYLSGADALNNLIVSTAAKLKKAGVKSYAKKLSAAAAKAKSEATSSLGQLPSTTQICQ
ncbi:MAG: hypothetical protein K1X79_09480 [Oligoflexia bacterium]|nr:hypothetical protein [Oligoflexia bacterium]